MELLRRKRRPGLIPGDGAHLRGQLLNLVTQVCDVGAVQVDALLDLLAGVAGRNVLRAVGGCLLAC
ncbi:hypothetical protein, partial [Corynebacterium sp.]|uniref:hypothetical protein n=1 Tax=Corynebacterium sp. TaxID=1720 RepID=UPI002A90B187